MVYLILSIWDSTALPVFDNGTNQACSDVSQIVNVQSQNFLELVSEKLLKYFPESDILDLFMVEYGSFRFYIPDRWEVGSFSPILFLVYPFFVWLIS